MPRLCCPTCGRSYVLHRVTRDARVRCPLYNGEGKSGVPLYLVGTGALVIAGLIGMVILSPFWTAPRAPRPVTNLAPTTKAIEPEPRFADEFPGHVDPHRIPHHRADWADFATNFRRIQNRETDVLMAELKAVPRVGMKPVRQAQANVVSSSINTDHASGPQAVLEMQPELAHLPFIMGGDCVLEPEAARDLATRSVEIRNLAPPGSLFTNTDRPRFISNHTHTESIAALTQIFQSEIGAGRYTMVEMLGKLSSRRAAEALVQRAVFDVDASIRMDAVYALKRRPVEQYRDKLLAMLNHPWDAAVQHAAEAIANLDGAIPVADLEAAQSATPRTRVTSRGETQVREVVRINHINNCLLCHAVSASRQDLVRAPIPDPYMPPTPVYYEERDQSLMVVRADVTYLRQDFAVMQPLSAEEDREAAAAFEASRLAGNRAAALPNQGQTFRFDYLVRTRPLREGEAADTPVDTVRTEAIAFALKGRRR